MKPEIYQNVVPYSKRFENNIRGLLPEEVKEFIISGVGMARARGYGSYFYILETQINGNPLTLKIHTHDSQDFDYYTDLEPSTHAYNNWIKKKVLNFLSDEVIYWEISEHLNK